MARKKKRHKVREHPRRLPSGRIIKVSAHKRGGVIVAAGVIIAIIIGAIAANRSDDEPEPGPVPSSATAAPSG